jgi:hypothetical protein
MREILNFIISGSATILCGVVCTFLVVLNMHKEEIWDAIYERYF